MIAEGRVEIELPKRPGEPVRVDYRQPFDVARLLAGRPVAEAVRLVGSIHAVCANAQSHAASLAIEAAVGRRAAPTTLRARMALTMLESWRESLLRVVLDWPSTLGTAVDLSVVRGAMRLSSLLRKALFGDQEPWSPDAVAAGDCASASQIAREMGEIGAGLVFEETGEAFLGRRGIAGLRDWATRRNSGPAVFMRRLLARDWALGNPDAAPSIALLPDAEAIPEWFDVLRAQATRADRIAPEATLYSRRRGDEPFSAINDGGILSRHASRLTELARLPNELGNLLRGDGKEQAASGRAREWGVSAVEAARGLLCHAATVQDGRVMDYCIIAPTRLNFHPNGIAARCLARIDDGKHRLERADLMIRAIDPCVAYDLRIA